MPFLLSEINRRIITDPRAFVEECDEIYARRISNAAERIIDNMKKSPIVLLSGPSGSGKTTTALKIEEELERRGVGTHTVALDNYFKTITKDSPRTPDGDIDFETPLCLDMDLLNEHFDLLSNGEKIYIPKYKFSRKMRIIEEGRSLKLNKDEIAVFEGIHALNSSFTERHPKAFKLYISARSNIYDNSENLVFKGTWMRLVRRAVRDNLFRGADALATMHMWADVRRGEKLYISPFKDKADIMFDSSFGYEVPLMKSIAPEVLKQAHSGVERFEELQSIIPAFERFEPLSPEYLSPFSLMREFIGGGIYSYK